LLNLLNFYVNPRKFIFYTEKCASTKAFAFQFADCAGEEMRDQNEGEKNANERAHTVRAI
jgi:hypothetical protein